MIRDLMPLRHVALGLLVLCAASSCTSIHYGNLDPRIPTSLTPERISAHEDDIEKVGTIEIERLLHFALFFGLIPLSDTDFETEMQDLAEAQGAEWISNVAIYERTGPVQSFFNIMPALNYLQYLYQSKRVTITADLHRRKPSTQPASDQAGSQP